jgi:O-succinylbenzoic acid--CoA ligase
MADSLLKVDMNSLQSQVFLSPFLSVDEQKTLQNLAEKYPMSSHIWIASSGSSKKENESLKLVALSKKALSSSANAVNTHLQVRAGDIWGLSLPTFHVGGLGILIRAQLAGVSCEPCSVEKWNPTSFVQLLQKKAVTLTSMVPTQVYDCVLQKLKSPPKLRAVLVGGAALNPSLYNEARRLGWPLLPCYGMTETCSQIATASLNSWESEDFPSMKLLSHVQMSVDSQQAAWVRSPALLTGYAYQQSGADFFVDPKLNGAWKIPDQILLDGDHLTPLGREEDFVKILAEGISLSRLRDRWMQAAIRFQVPVNGFELLAVSDARSGMALLLVVEKDLAENPSWKQMLEFLQKESLKIEWPSRYQQIVKIPRSSLGKVLKESLFQMIHEGL